MNEEEYIKKLFEQVDNIKLGLKYYSDKARSLKKDFRIYENMYENRVNECITNYIHKDKIKEILDKAECMDYYTLADVIEDLEKLVKEDK